MHEIKILAFYQNFGTPGKTFFNNVVEEMVCRSLRRLPKLGQTPERITALAGRAGH
eukprot:SAG11_NODE_4537_length_1860_cov_2.444634_3_plen_55_part_01